MPKRSGRPSASQTPAPKSDVRYGSTKNVKGSASTEGSSIKLSAKTINTLEKKLKEFKEKHPNAKNINLSDLKKVYRRGSGAYSKSHRPTITGGVPNSRAAWSFARVNKFLLKAGGTKVKAAYVQDDDLMAKGGKVFNDKQLLARYKKGESIGFTGVAHLKAKGLISRADGTKRKSEKYMEDGGDIYAKGGKTKGGDCYYMAGQFAMDNIFTPKLDYIGTPYLVHAEVKGQGKLQGVRYGHAWIEDDENVYDFSNNREIIIPKIIYYAIGDIRTDNPVKYQKYTFEQARKKMMETKNYGCWDLDVQYAEGGSVGENVQCINCAWEWNTSDSDYGDRYVCHKCGFDNSLYYDKPILKAAMSIQEIATKFNLPEEEIIKEVQKGMEHEKEHTENEDIARTIALHHVAETPDYYEKLQSLHIEENVMKEGGVVVGKRHSEMAEDGTTGERFLVESTGQIVEVEGGEGVLGTESMNSSRKFEFQGKKMSGREIASFLNHKYGGVEFEKGGQVKDVCGCKSMYYHGGELPTSTLDSLKGGEAVITVKTMESKDKYKFGNKELTPRQILSRINELSGGKKFDEGGVIDLSKHRFENEVRLTQMVRFTEKILY